MSRPLTVAEIRGYLSELPDDMPVVALYDCRCAGGSVVQIEVGPGPDDPCESVVVIVE